MNPNDNKNNKNRKNGGNWRGAASLVGWALVLTIVISYAGSVLGGAGRQASSVNLEYSDFLEMVEAGQAESVEFDNAEAILFITPEGRLCLHQRGRRLLRQDRGRLRL